MWNDSLIHWIIYNAICLNDAVKLLIVLCNKNFVSQLVTGDSDKFFPVDYESIIENVSMRQVFKKTKLKNQKTLLWQVVKKK